MAARLPASEGHARAVVALCLLTDGRLASGSSGRHHPVVDVETGTETARPGGAQGSVNTLCALPDGRARVGLP